ncbi:histone-lysine N-methyltransferase SETMAR [Trichonephila clavipes]|nr:histone-lysine N-methyltransferase SETMAR [Trichonephila clavipes]
MARRLENWSRLKVRAVIRFLWTKNVSASDTHSQIVEVYGEELMLRQHRYHSDGQHFIDHIVTRDETWIHHFVPGSKKATMEWKHRGSPTTKKFKLTPSEGAWLDHQRRLLLCHFDKVTRNYPTQTAGMLSESVILLYDNARPHTAQVTQVGNLESPPPLQHTAQIWHPMTICCFRGSRNTYLADGSLQTVMWKHPPRPGSMGRDLISTKTG